MIHEDRNYEEKIVNGMAIGFAVNKDGPVSIYYMQIDETEYYTIGEPLYDRSKDLEKRYGQIVYLSELAQINSDIVQEKLASAENKKIMEILIADLFRNTNLFLEFE